MQISPHKSVFSNTRKQLLAWTQYCAFYCIGSALGVVVMLKNEAVADQTLPRWCYIMDQNLTVVYCVRNSINLGKIFKPTG